MLVPNLLSCASYCTQDPCPGFLLVLLSFCSHSYLLHMRLLGTWSKFRVGCKKWRLTVYLQNQRETFVVFPTVIRLGSVRKNLKPRCPSTLLVKKKLRAELRTSAAQRRTAQHSTPASSDRTRLLPRPILLKKKDAENRCRKRNEEHSQDQVQWCTAAQRGEQAQDPIPHEETIFLKLAGNTFPPDSGLTPRVEIPWSCSHPKLEVLQV